METSQKYTVVYGITSATTSYISNTNVNENIIFASTKGTEPFGEKVYSLQELSSLARDEIEKIVICSQHVNEIVNSLLVHDFNLGIIYFFNHHSNLLESCYQKRHPTVRMENTLYAIYDLTINLPSYDIFTFIILAELRRKELGLQHVHFIVLPANSNDSDVFSMNVLYEDNDFNWRIKNLIVPAFSCLPSCSGYSKLAFKEELTNLIDPKVTTYPEDFLARESIPAPTIPDFKPYIEKQQSLCVIKAPSIASEAIDQYLESVNPKRKKLVLIILRELDMQHERNNELNSWAKFTKQLDRSEYCVVIVRDAYKAFSSINVDAFGLCEVFPLSACDVTFRLALYEKAYISLGVSSGALYPLYFIPQAKAIKFQFVSDSNPSNSLRNIEKLGATIDKDAFFRANQYQKLIWKPDTFENIQMAFNNLLDSISE